MNKIPADLSGKILIVGPDYKNHRGGIAALIETYSTLFEDFKFLSTYKSFENDFAKILYFIKQAIKIPHRLRIDKNIQIVHIHGSHSASLYRKFIVFLFAKRLFRKKVIYHIHSGSYDVVFQNSGAIPRWIIRTMVNQSDMIICLSNFWFRFFAENFKPNRLTVVNNVVNSSSSSIVLPRRPGSVTNFLFLGRVNDGKGIFDLLDILSSKADFFVDRLKLYIGGDGEIERLETYVRNNNLGAIVEYIGWVDAAKKEEYFLKSHIFILPSYIEGLPVSLLEAMSYGMPIISTNVGGIPEILENGVNGFMISPGDKKAMEAAILQFLNYPDKIAAFGKASLKKIEPYLPENVTRQLVNCYEALLEPTPIS
ncbi:MAG TPA: glycosyltransferase family 4 protein [Mucilaginibacter sp.]|jgi:glycosyltransferase involved in cell wall biosynthesis|nr:glycosyltransferase family 4 protein [Mucilaginibacter sp.]